MVDVPPSGVADSSNLTHGSQEIEGKVLDHAIRRLTQLSRIDTLGKCIQAVFALLNLFSTVCLQIPII